MYSLDSLAKLIPGSQETLTSYAIFSSVSSLKPALLILSMNG
jgi:hypothetical protein